MRQYSFVVEGPLLGYRASLRRAHDPKYKRFKDYVRLLANEQGVPESLKPTDRAEVYVHVWWRKTARIDGSNLLKAIEDSIWKQDRRVLLSQVSMFEHNQKTEWAEVTIKL